MACNKVTGVSKGQILEPHIYAVRDTTKQLMFLYVHFEKDPLNPLLESVECFYPGRDPYPYELYTDPMETRTIRITVGNTTGDPIPDEGGYVAISIPLKQLCFSEKFAFVDIDHKGANHGGKGTIHWP